MWKNTEIKRPGKKHAVSDASYNPSNCEARKPYILKRRIVFVLICICLFFLFLSLFVPYVGLDSYYESIYSYSMGGKEFGLEMFSALFTKMIGYNLCLLFSFCLVILILIYRVLQMQYIKEKRKCIGTIIYNDNLSYEEFKAEMGDKSSLVDQVIYEGLISPIENSGKTSWDINYTKIYDYNGK